MFLAGVEVRDGALLELARRVRKAGFEATADKLELAWSRQDKTLSLETADREALLNVLADGPDELADLGSVLLQEQEAGGREGTKRCLALPAGHEPSPSPDSLPATGGGLRNVSMASHTPMRPR